MLPNGIELDETLIFLKRGNNARVDLIVSNTSEHDIPLESRTVIGTLQLVRSVTPADVKLKEPAVDSKRKGEVKTTTANQKAGQPYQDEVVPEVILNDHLTAEQKRKIREMLSRESDSFCKDENDIGCANDLHVKI